mmetsp:Transcript_28923/g.76314  ORF Transcript_28923/g.76314 Transcript_28923/m.76314 type:complete len:306 (-) Transcript_28923:384-1301(-)|eukprot:CAMPEP_0194533002 /NCGR_PEP_ID=MMETSP0253-20130528/70741_1 /TAXON_ID=2966 /ORGANISM="Noctiluca scintillans" /LENGTH=305 /DNA_ID=CAMNT_0039378509 /DNA_START=79 /DNA_END=996 /DNA_ORIENTATION=+
MFKDFGSVEKSRLQLSKVQRQRMDAISIITSLFLPWILFNLVFADVSFFLHYVSSTFCWLVTGLIGLVVLGIGALAAASVSRKHSGDETREPSWLVFVFMTSVIALATGVIFGNVNYWTYMQPYYDIMHMNKYTEVDPVHMRGQQIMDAGQISFLKTAEIDTKLSMGFKSGDTYCVAPVTIGSTYGPTSLSSYDFWVVGINCCSPLNADFHCGEYASPSAHAGLRLLRDEQRAFFRLAVQEAESAYAIRAIHPLFMYWVEDPAEDMLRYRDEGYRWYFLGMLMHFVFQFICVVLASRAFLSMAKF